MNVAAVVQFIAGFAWLLLIGMVAIVVTRASRAKPVKASITVLLILAAVAILLSSVSAGLVFIQPEERGVVISALSPIGYREEPLQPGLRWIIPFFENVITYPISKETYTMSIAPNEGEIQGDDSITARTADGQEIFVDASVIFSIDPAEVVKVHIAWQDRYSDDLVRPLARGVIRDVVSQFGVEEVVTSQRVLMVQEISDQMTTKLEANGLILVDFILRNITFSTEYAASVEQKQIAEQLAQQAVFVVEQRKQEAEQARQAATGQADAIVIRAQGDADALIIAANAEAEARVIEATAEREALLLIAEALENNDNLLLYQYISKIAPGLQVMLLPSDNPFILNLPTLDTLTNSFDVPLPEDTTPNPTETP
jgi:regulator of protease activity HflC (stomatin/prohibitin superfamily)